MKAILVTEANFDKIRETETSIIDFDLNKVELQSEEDIYYVPDYSQDEDDTVDYAVTGWGTIPEPYMSQHYDFDKEAAATNFVTITPKD